MVQNYIVVMHRSEGMPNGDRSCWCRDLSVLLLSRENQLQPLATSRARTASISDASPAAPAAALSLSSNGDVIISAGGQLLCYGFDVPVPNLHVHDITGGAPAAAPVQVSRMTSVDSNALLQSECPSWAVHETVLQDQHK